MLARGGHITPLAQDTLRERRVTVVREGRASADDAALAPAADIRTVAIASDHTGVALRQDAGRVSARPRPGGARSRHRRHRPGRLSGRRGVGRAGSSPAAKPTPASSIDGAGIGSAIAANKIDGHPGGDGDDRDDRALLARAQRRQRPDARRDAGDRRTRRGRSSSTLADDADARAALHPAARQDPRRSKQRWLAAEAETDRHDARRTAAARSTSSSSELTAAAARAAGPLRVPRGARRLLSRPAARRARRRRDPRRPARRRAARRPASRR